MKTKTRKLPKSQIELEVEVESQDFERFFERALKGMSESLNIPGFRQGKVSREIALEKLGQENVLLEAARLAVSESCSRLILENNIEVISQPQIQIMKLAPKNPFSFKAVFSVLPEFKTPDYKEIVSKLKKKEILVNEPEIDETLGWLQKSRPSFKDTKKQAQKGDFVEIEFSSPQIQGGVGQKDAFFLGKGFLVNSFEENLEGMRNGEKKNFSVSFPENHFQKELCGKEISFDVKMVKVSEVEFPEINDEFARSLGSFKDLNGLRKSIREEVRMEKEMAETQKLRDEILDRIENRSVFEAPEILIETEKHKAFKELKEKIEKELKISFDEYLKRIKKTEAELLETFREATRKKVRRFLVLREISKKENIDVSEEEVKEGVNNILKKYPDENTVQKEVDLGKLEDYVRESIRSEKTLLRLESFVQKNKIE